MCSLRPELRRAVLLCAALAPLLATADDTAPSHSFTLSAQGDSEHAKVFDAALALPLGDWGWTQLGIGHNTSGSGADEVQARLTNITIGARGDRFGASIGYARRDGDDTLTEQDATGVLDYFGARFG